MTTAPFANVAKHVAPQLIPVGELVTVPVFVPDFVTVRVWFAGVTLTCPLVPVIEELAVSVAVTVWLPAVLNLTLKGWIPASFAVNV